MVLQPVHHVVVHIGRSISPCAGDVAAGQKIARIPLDQGRRLLENSDCSVLFRDCKGLLLLRTDEWHSNLQTHALRGRYIQISLYEVRLNGEMLFYDRLLVY